MKPLLHFLLLGGLLFGAQRLTATWPLCTRAQTIHISAEQVATLQRDWQRQLGRAPDAAQLQAGVRRLADEEMLLREAVRLGLNRSDRVVRGRLLKNMRFAYPESGDEDEILLKKALALRMDQRDFVVRRRLIQLMEQRLATGAEVSDEALRRTIAEHPERYGGAARVAFHQVFVNGDLHRADLQSAALRVQSQLQAGRTDDPGDVFLGGHQFGASSETDIAKIFGAAFARAAIRAPAKTWIGPIASVYGLHFIYVDAVVPAQDADLEAVRSRATYAVLEQQEHSRVQQALGDLRQRYPLVVDAPAPTLGDAR